MTQPLQSPFSRPVPRWRHPGALAWALLFAAVVGGAVFASASAPEARDEPGVREVVQSQLQALAAQDAGRAFALADPQLRTRFGSADAFFDTVRTQYPMVLKPHGVLFLKPASDGTMALQKVRVTDEAGSNWMVTYLLHRQSDHGWKISGTLVEPDGLQVIA